MQKAFEPWQLKQLVRLSQHTPHRAQEVLNLIWSSQPNLYSELAIAAVDQEQLSVDRCAEILQLSVIEVEALLVSYRQSSHQPTLETPTPVTQAVVHGEGALARLPESGVAVWEVVRKYRQAGSWQALLEAFPSVNVNELSMALEYANEHRQEVNSAIEHYEAMLEKRKSLYPYAR
jgi:uncharacterized protein (DUF433 family)/predicted HTH domain antitoxin